MKKTYVVIFSVTRNVFEIDKSKMAAIEFWECNSAHIFATKCDRNMNNISFLMFSGTRKSILQLFLMKDVHKLQ